MLNLFTKMNHKAYAKTMKDTRGKDESHDSQLASEYMVAIAKNFYKGQIKSSNSIKAQVKQIINKLYSKQIFGKYRRKNEFR